MSITSEIARLRAAKADIKSAIEDKGVRVPDETTIDGYGELIGEIEQGTSDFDWASIGYDEMPPLMRADFEYAATRKADYDARPYNKFSAFADVNLALIPKGLDWSLLTYGGQFNGNRSMRYLPEDADFRHLTNTKYMFQGCQALGTLPEGEGITFPNVEDATQMFYQCTCFVELPDTARFSDKLRLAPSMFSNCSNLKKLPKGDFSNVTDASTMFNACGQLEIGSEETFVIAPTNADRMFSACAKIQHVPSGLDFSNIVNAPQMFNSCGALLDLPSDIDLSNVVTANSMFQGCANLVSVPSVINMPNLNNGQYLFYACPKLTRLVLNVPNATNLTQVANNCTVLTYLELNGAKVSFSINSCQNISLEGVTALINSVADLTGQTRQTMTLSSATKALLTNELRALATAKNWTIA